MSYIKPPRPDAEPQKFSGTGNFKYNILTKPGVSIRFNQPSAGKAARGRILPCFDFSVDPKDEDFKVSWTPYRDETEMREDEHASWNQFYFPFDIYSFYGVNKRSFFSPKNLTRLGLATTAADAWDPISRMNYLVNKDPKWSQYKHLTLSTFNAAPGTPPPALGRPRTMALLNFYGTFGDREEENYVLMLPETGLEFIKKQLNKYGKKSAPVRDKNWPDYMFGDVTHPKTGLLAWSVLKPIMDDKTANTLTFSKIDDSASDAEVVPVDDEILSRRLNFFDVENGIHIPTPQEVLDMVLEDDVVPLELIKFACGNYLEVPDAPTKPAQSNWDRAQEAQVDKANGKEPSSPFKTREAKPVEDDEMDDIPFVKPSKRTDDRKKTLSTEELAAVTKPSEDEGDVAPVIDYEATLKLLSEMAKLKAAGK